MLSTKRIVQGLGLFLVVIALTSTSAFGQSGVIQGTLLDPQGASIVDAKVTALDEAKNLVVRETKTQPDGSFQLRPMLQGTYTIKIESAGFKSIERKGVVLDPNQIINLGALSMQLGQATETVTVEAQTPLVETSTAQRGFVITSRQVTELSLNGRDFQSLMRTLPGVVSNDASDFRLAFNNTDSFNVNGLRGSQNNFYLDGSINTDVGANDGQYTQLSMDAVGEFKEQAGVFNAEYGRNPGILLSATMKSGTKSFHGTAYEFLRNNAFDARKPFDTTGTTAKLNFNQFGGNLGGPIYAGKLSPRKDPRLFFFFNYEGTRASRPNGNTFVDTVAPSLLTGDFSKALKFNADGSPSLIKNTNFNEGTVFQPGTIVRDAQNNIIGGQPFPNNIVPKSLWSQNAQAFLNVVNKLDRSTGTPTPGNPALVRVPMQDIYRFRKDQKALRIDYAISSKVNFFFHWVDDAQRESQNLGIFSGNSYPVLPQYRKKPGSSWAWNLVNVISPTTTNEVIFTYNHLTQVVDIRDDVSKDSYDRTALGFKFQELYPNSNTRSKFPQFSCGSSCSISSFPSNWVSEGKTFALTDNFTKIFGPHTFKTGIFVNRNNNGQQPSWTDAININFAPSAQNPNDTNNQTANMLLGNYTSLSQTNGRFYGSFRFLGIEAFAQDSWKVNRKLTLELGLRWAYMGPTNTYGQFLQNYFVPSAYDPAQAAVIETSPGQKNGSIIGGNPFNGMIEEGSKGLPLGGIDHRFNNFAPRFGLAYDPFGDGKTAIRAGYGWFYERIRQNNINFDGLGNPPLSYTPNLYNGNVDAISPSLIAAGTRFPVQVTAIDRSGKIPTIYSWSIGVQRQLTKDTSIDVAYVGNAARHLMYVRDLNQLPLGTLINNQAYIAANRTAQAFRPFRGYNSINYTDFGAVSNYNALQTRFSRRFARNLTLNASYVWSKAMDETDGDTTTITYFLNRHFDYGPAGFDRTHVFNLDYVYGLPDFGSKLSESRAVKLLLDGWQFSGITRFWTGNAATITSGTGNAGTLGGSYRATYIGGQIIPDQRDRYHYWNPLAFGYPADGTLGNVGRNTLRLPGINNWDMSLFKSLKFTEAVSMQLRFEFFNVFNHTQWSGVNTGISNGSTGQAVTSGTIGTAGQVTSTRDPRSLQMAVKFYF